MTIHALKRHTGRPLSIAIMLAFVFGCRADDPVKQGAVGELCNGRDDDCRIGLACVVSVCVDPGGGPTYDCGDICSRLAGECGAAEPGCESDCVITTSAWALRARESFGVCLVEDLTCAQAQATFAPQTCYSRIEIPAERFALCEVFAQQALACGAATDDAERVLERCAALARVGPEARWQDPASCGSVIETGNCSEVATCFNQELEIDPPINFVTF